MRIGHVISPFLAPESSDLHIAQPITFRSMSRARGFTEHDITLMAFPAEAQDVAVIPGDFITLPVATRTTQDVIPSTTRRPLPLLADIIGGALKASDVDVLVYANADIAVQPYFYDYVARRMADLDALVINRKTVIRDIDQLDDLSFYYSQKGEKHPGFDCFIARCSLWQEAEFDEAFVGGNWIGRVILANMVSLGRRFALEEDVQMTFHLGDDRSWQNPAMAAYHAFNNRALVRSCKRLIERDKDQRGVLKRLVDGHSRDRYPDIGPELRFATEESNSLLPQDPIFVVGFPRSGTTLFQSVIERGARNIITTPETHFFNVLRSLGFIDSAIFDSAMIIQVLEALSEKLVIGEAMQAQLRRPFLELPIKRFFELVIRDQLVQNYGEERVSAGDFRWLEKTPGHAVALKRIAALYPRAKFVYALRHPMFSFTSWRKNAKQWGDTNTAINFLTGVYQNHLKSGLEFKKARPDALLFAKLEHIVRDKMPVLDSLSRFLGEPIVDVDIRKQATASHIVKDFEPWKLDAIKSDISPSIAYPKELLITRKEMDHCWGRIGPLLQEVGYPKVFDYPTTLTPKTLDAELAKGEITPMEVWL